MKKVELKRCTTVGALIKELEKLPKSAKLKPAITPTQYNIGKTAKEHNLKPCICLDEDW